MPAISTFSADAGATWSRFCGPTGLGPRSTPTGPVRDGCRQTGDTEIVRQRVRGVCQHDQHRSRGRGANPGLIALRHDPALLRLAPAATRGRPAFLPANRLLRLVRHPQSCPLDRLMDTKPAAIHDRSLSSNPAKPDRRSSAEGYAAGARHAGAGGGSVRGMVARDG